MRIPEQYLADKRYIFFLDTIPEETLVRLAIAWYAVKRLRDHVAHLSPPRLPPPPFSASSYMWAQAKYGAAGKMGKAGLAGNTQ